ncbi:MAG: Zn-ribbon domain-containing OB-fold protein [Thermodesulfobacteriota bacterium]
MSKHFGTIQSLVWLPYQFSLGPVFSRFLEGMKEERIWANRCPQCHKVLVPARTFCPECYVDMAEWEEASQEGEVVSWVGASRNVYGAPVEAPFVGALIRLDGTDCNFLHLIGEADTTEIKRGTRVKALWNREKSGWMTDIKYFVPV